MMRGGVSAAKYLPSVTSGNAPPVPDSLAACCRAAPRCCPTRAQICRAQEAGGKSVRRRRLAKIGSALLASRRQRSASPAAAPLRLLPTTHRE